MRVHRLLLVAAITLNLQIKPRLFLINKTMGISMYTQIHRYFVKCQISSEILFVLCEHDSLCDLSQSLKHHTH